MVYQERGWVVLALRLNQEASKLLALLLALTVCMLVVLHSATVATSTTQPVTMDTYSNGVSNLIQGGLWIVVGVASAVAVVLTAPVSVPLAIVSGIVAVGSTVAGTLQAASGISDIYTGALERACGEGCAF